MASLRNNILHHLILYFILIVNIEITKQDDSDNLNKTISDLAVSSSEKLLRKYLLQFRDSALNFTELTVKHGYKSKEYTVQTEDGYLLSMFRILKPKHCKSEKKGLPVIIQHGLQASSDCFLQAGPGNALGYLLADACYDVWFPNQRGNNYGRRHLYLNPDTDKEFWKFSVDEIGYYDIPAMIDTVLHQTGARKVNYIGHSQGCGTFYIMCSERPDYCRDKVNLKISLAPATRHLNSKSVGFRAINEFYGTFQYILEGLGVYEAFPQESALREFFNDLCKFKMAYPVCIKVLAATDAFNPGSIPYSTLKVIFGQVPAGTSVQNMARYGQAVNSEEFKKFDYGFLKNVIAYGRFLPPVYNLKAVSTPTVVFYGNNDGVVDKDDIKWLIPKLGNVIDVVEVADPYWTHLDFIYSRFIPQYIFGEMEHYLRIFSNID